MAPWRATTPVIITMDVSPTIPQIATAQLSIMTPPIFTVLPVAWITAPASMPRAAAVTVPIISWPRSTPPASHVLRPDQANRDKVAEHRLLQGDQRVARQHEAFVFLKQVTWFFDEELSGEGKQLDVVSPGNHLRPPEVLAGDRGLPEPLHPRRRAEDSSAVVLLQACARTPVSSRWTLARMSCRTAWSCRFHGEKRRVKPLPSTTPAAATASRTRWLLQRMRKSEGQCRCTVKLSSAIGTFAEIAPPASDSVTNDLWPQTKATRPQRSAASAVFISGERGRNTLPALALFTPASSNAGCAKARAGALCG
jgi:hypothetical protein